MRGLFALLCFVVHQIVIKKIKRNVSDSGFGIS